MIRIFPLLCMAAILIGCASQTYPLLKCDGYSRWPLNRPMWQWEDNSNLNQKHSDIRSVAPEPGAATYVAETKELQTFAHLKIDAPSRACEG